MTTPTKIRLHLDKFVNVLDAQGRPVMPGCSTLTVEQAAAKLATFDLGPYLDAEWNVYRGDSYPTVEHQVAVKVRRLKALAAKIGRNVVRVQRTETGYHALLAR